MTPLTLEQIAAFNGNRDAEVNAVLARELLALRDCMQVLDDFHDSIEHAEDAIEKRLDALEHQARPLQEDGERDGWASRRIAEVERERDEWQVRCGFETRRADAARAALAKYGRHLHDCRVVGALPLLACTCGLTAALNASPA